eukprot:Phypoly_transcript_15482.p1 GENE.Phypoly_transcript_15482~~Phypoly_transcript_15482.p1  ORF type:complete len:172 (+),score=20.63 Phypoly_transcript_15482:25-516(+)
MTRNETEVVSWANEILKIKHEAVEIKNVDEDFKDGVNLAKIFNTLSTNWLDYHETPVDREQKIENVEMLLEMFPGRRIKVDGISASDIVDGNVKSTLELLGLMKEKQSNISRYVTSIEPGSGVEEVIGSLNKQLQPYNITVDDFCFSWENGRALCALVDSLQL